MKSSVKIKAVLSSPEFKVIQVSGDVGDTLEKHKVNINAMLLVKKGSVTYKEGNQQLVLSESEGHNIPAEVYHEVSCNETAEIFLVIPKQAKMKFER